MEIKTIINGIKDSNFNIIWENKFISVIGIILLLIFINTSIWTSFDGLITTGTLLAVIFNLAVNNQKKIEESQIIPIYFIVKETNIKYQLNLDIPRKDITRSEIQGLLSNFSTDSTKRYNIDFMSDLEYLENIYQVQNNKKHQLEIYISEIELSGKKEGYVGFDLMKMKQL